MRAADVSHDLCARQHLDVLLGLNDVDDLGGQACLDGHHGKTAILGAISLKSEEKGNWADAMGLFHLDAASGSDEALYL